MNENRTRNEEKCRSVISKDGRYSPKLDKATSTRFIRYCELMNVNKAMTACRKNNRIKYGGATLTGASGCRGAAYGAGCINYNRIAVNICIFDFAGILTYYFFEWFIV